MQQFWWRAGVHAILCVWSCTQPAAHYWGYVHHTMISFCMACLLALLQKWNGSYFQPMYHMGWHRPSHSAGASSQKILFRPPLQMSQIHCHPHQWPLPYPHWLLWMGPFHWLWLQLTATPSVGVISCYTTSLKPVQCLQCPNTFTCKICGERSLVTNITWQ